MFIITRNPTIQQRVGACAQRAGGVEGGDCGLIFLSLGKLLLDVLHRAPAPFGEPRRRLCRTSLTEIAVLQFAVLQKADLFAAHVQYFLSKNPILKSSCHFNAFDIKIFRFFLKTRFCPRPSRPIYRTDPTRFPPVWPVTLQRPLRLFARLPRRTPRSAKTGDDGRTPAVLRSPSAVAQRFASPFPEEPERAAGLCLPPLG